MTTEPDYPTLTERTQQIAYAAAQCGVTFEEARRAFAALSIPLHAGRGQRGALVRPDTPHRCALVARHGR